MTSLVDNVESEDYIPSRGTRELPCDVPDIEAATNVVEPFTTIPINSEPENIEILEIPERDNTFIGFVNTVRKYYVFPVVSCILHGLQWSFFLWGLHNVTNPEMNAYAGKDIYNRLSPPVETFFFMTVNYWPLCTDARSNTWRVISYQFAHSGYGHILSNTVIGIIFSSWLEIFHPWCGIFVFTVYQLSVIFGALAFSYIYPYRGMIGSSGGVYGILGACAAHLILDMEYIPDVARKLCRNTYLFSYGGVGLFVFLTLIQDVVSYFIAYKGNIAYSAHIAGWIIGLFLGCTFALIRPIDSLRKMPRWKLIVASIGAAGFVGQTIFLSYHYWHYWPPVPNGTASQHYSCCAEILEKVYSDNTLTIEIARSQYTCQGDKYGIIKKMNDKGDTLSFLAW